MDLLPAEMLMAEICMQEDISMLASLGLRRGNGRYLCLWDNRSGDDELAVGLGMRM